MKRCEHCKTPLKVGDEVHVLDEEIFCSEECAILHLTDYIICNAKETAKEQYHDEATIITYRPTKDSAVCKTCGKDLSECESIWAAEGNLYCSRECGIQDYIVDTGVADNTVGREYATNLFDNASEELNPKDIGLGEWEDE